MIISPSFCGSSITIEPKPTKIGAGPAASQRSKAAYGTSSKASPLPACLKAKVPTTSTKLGQSAGLGTKAADHMYEIGTRKREKSAP